MPERFLFQSFLQAGFECSTHKRRTGERLDLLRLTEHDRLIRSDFHFLRQYGLRTIRTAARWHLIEYAPGDYDFHTLRELLEAAAHYEIEVLLDLFHFGWPDFLDVFAPAFLTSFARFTHALAKFMKTAPQACTMIAPVNEISFLAWAGGEKACVNPYAQGRSAELKRQLVRAAAASCEILLNELPGIRLLSPEPVIHIVGNPLIPGDDIEAENYRLSQFQAWDMLSGRLEPELGGRPEYLDVIGTNFYERNEWVHQADRPLPRTDPRYRPFHRILQEVWQRYRRPMFVSETGTEGDARAEWFNYICDEVARAIDLGVPIEGICLYPILNHPGWEDDRHCHNGLFDYPDREGKRSVHWPLAHEVIEQQRRFTRREEVKHATKSNRSDLPLAPALGLRFPKASTSDEPVCESSTGLLSGGANI